MDSLLYIKDWKKEKCQNRQTKKNETECVGGGGAGRRGFCLIRLEFVKEKR